MPTGYIEHQINFFNASHYSNVPKCPRDYEDWLGTMYAEFGMKWHCLHNGPTWQHDEHSGLKSTMIPGNAKINNASLALSTLRTRVVNTGIFKTTEIQGITLDKASECNPGARWWIKADGCDVIPGLHESVCLEWSGDVDLNDETLQKTYKKYRDRLKDISSIGKSSTSQTRLVLSTLQSELTEDLQYLQSALESKTSELDKLKVSQPTKVVTELEWDVREYHFLLKDASGQLKQWLS
ncbi:uncharacterized protein LOC134184419 isoform X4 [Corticium candelabrum]|nr:uncharacterized protein LOC134184419 isoform X4 [Corticium candelabrum]